MEKIIKIAEYEIPVKSTAASLISYKANFGRDGLQDLMRMAKSLKGFKGDMTDDMVGGIDLDTFFRFMWVFAKAADPQIKPIEQWLEGYDVAPLDFAFAAIPQIMDLLGKTVKSTVPMKSKN